MTTTPEVKKQLKEGSEWRDGIYYTGWNEYITEVRRIFSAYIDYVPYSQLRDLAGLILQVPARIDCVTGKSEDPTGIKRNEKYQAVQDIINAAEEINTAASNAAAQMTVMYPSQIPAKTLRKDARDMRENPDGGCQQAGFAWWWVRGATGDAAHASSMRFEAVPESEVAERIKDATSNL